MKLNCWPGCTAQIVKVTPDVPAWAAKEMLNKVIVTADSLRSRFGEPAWTYSGQPLVLSDGMVVEIVPDSYLMPITPPAGAVSDEEVSELYEPITKRTPETE